MTQQVYINTADQLHKFCQQVSNAPWLAVDTEFMREKTYYPKLCLVQIASEQHIACIDPLLIDDLTPLWTLLYDENIIKILHAARQDLELLYHLTQRLPWPIFDTQIAATLLGLGDQTAYASLVKSLLGIELDKSQTRTDWSKRPLDQEQLHYAANDVRYLAKCYPVIMQKLHTQNRQLWLDNDFQQMNDTKLYDVNIDDIWQRVSGKQKLKGNALGVLQSLARWREQTAQQKNLPRKWILKDDILIGLAMKRPNNNQQLAKIRGLSHDMIERMGEKLLNIINQQTHSTPEKIDYPGRLSPQQDALVDAMLAILRLCAAQEVISPTIIATRKDLEKMLLGNHNIELLQGWRAEVAGKTLQAFLRGELTLKTQQQQLVISSC